MDDRLKQLLVAAPSLVAGLRGNGTATQAFMEGYQRTLAQLQQQQALTGQQAIQSAQFQQASDRQAMLDRERQEDRATRAQDREWQESERVLSIMDALRGVMGQAESIPQAEAESEAILGALPESARETVAGLRDSALRQVPANITSRRKSEFTNWVENTLMNSQFARENPDQADATASLPPRMLETARMLRPDLQRFTVRDVLNIAETMRPARESARNPNREALALEAAGGDPARALRLLREPVAGSSASEPLVEVLGPDGRPTWMPRSQAAGMPTTRAAGNTQQQEAADTASEVSRIATDLLKHPGLPGAFGVIDSRIPTVRQTTADAEALRDSLISLLTLENMGKMKGVLSDSDMRVLQRASTTLRESMSDQAAKTELQRVIRVMQKAALGMPEPPMDRNNSSDALTVTTPDGKTYTFPTKRAADQFRRQIGGQ